MLVVVRIARILATWPDIRYTVTHLLDIGDLSHHSRANKFTVILTAAFIDINHTEAFF